MKFFLSHSSQDHELVKQLVEMAGALGIDLYLAEHDAAIDHVNIDLPALRWSTTEERFVLVHETLEEERN